MVHLYQSLGRFDTQAPSFNKSTLWDGDRLDPVYRVRSVENVAIHDSEFGVSAADETVVFDVRQPHFSFLGMYVNSNNQRSSTRSELFENNDDCSELCETTSFPNDSGDTDFRIA